MALTIGLTGRPRVEVDGVAVDDEGLGRLGRVALACLVSERDRPLPRDELAEVMWGEHLPATWESSLRTHVTKLRAVLRASGLASNTLVARAGCYQLHLPPGAIVDLEAAVGALDQARALLPADPRNAQRIAAETATIAGRQFPRRPRNLGRTPPARSAGVAATGAGGLGRSGVRSPRLGGRGAHR